MKYILAISFAMLISVCGCVTSRVHPEFYEVVKSHKILTEETIDAVINSIKDELSERQDLSLEQVASIKELIYRLEFVKKQAIVMNQYIEVTQVDQDFLKELLRHKWTQQVVKPVVKQGM